MVIFLQLYMLFFLSWGNIFLVSTWDVHIGVNFYKAARLQPPPTFQTPRLSGFWAPHPQFFVTCNAYYEAVFCGLPNNKMTPNDIHDERHFPLVRKPLKAVDIMSLSTHDRSGLSHDIVQPGTINNSVLLIISVLSFKGIHNGICNLRFFSMCTSLLHGWMSMTLHSPVCCSVTRWITRMGSTFDCMVQGSFLTHMYSLLSRPS